MKKLKRLLILLAVLLLIVAVLAVIFVLIPKLNEGKVVADINGLTPAQAFQKAIELREEAPRYEYTVGMRTAVKVLFVPIYQFEVDPFVLYSYDGESQYGLTYSEARQKLKDNDMWDREMENSSLGYDEYWYIDGYTYTRKGNQKDKELGQVFEEYSEYEREVSNLLAAQTGEVTCYRKGELYYFTIETTNYYGDPETYTVYLTAEGRIEKIVNMYGYTESGLVSESVLTCTYHYDDLAPIEAPADAENYQ